MEENGLPQYHISEKLIFVGKESESQSDSSDNQYYAGICRCPCQSTSNHITQFQILGLVSFIYSCSFSLSAKELFSVFYLNVLCLVYSYILFLYLLILVIKN